MGERDLVGVVDIGVDEGFLIFLWVKEGLEGYDLIIYKNLKSYFRKN